MLASKNVSYTFFAKYCIFQKWLQKKKNCENNFHIPMFGFLFVGKTCRKTWTFTRVPQLEFVGDANEEITNVNDIGKQNALKK